MSEKNCPICHSAMVLRTARRGKNAGGQFWGCSKYPSCKGTLAQEVEDELRSQKVEVSFGHPVNEHRTIEPVYWRDGLSREGYNSEYIAIGAIPGFAVDQRSLKDKDVRRVASQALFLSKRSQVVDVTNDQRNISSIIQKLLTRGTLPLTTLRVEETLVTRAGLKDNITKLDLPDIEIGWKWVARPPKGLRREICDIFSRRSPLSQRNIATLTNEVLYNLLDGENEKYFFSKWLAQTFEPEILHWITPQAELDLILASAGIEQSGQRKIDFLFCHPTVGTYAIELDGEDHDEKVLSDEARNNSLAQTGIKTFRIPNQELEIGDGPNLKDLERALHSMRRAFSDDTPNEMAEAISLASLAARFQFVLARALSAGQLDIATEKWSVGVYSDVAGFDVFQSAADDFADMVASLSTLYSDYPAIIKISVHDIKKSKAVTDLNIAAFSSESPLSVGLRISNEDYVFCPAFAPVEFATDTQKVLGTNKLSLDAEEQIDAALLFFLQNLFRKRAFRELQSEAIKNALRGQDTVTLLPTGAGKSIIYQLAGLLQNGITLVVDPIVALIEDQILGLARVGIDKAGAPPSGFNKSDARKKWLRAVERGDFQFILMSPERLQMGDTREALRALAEVTFINLAVIDEAHCVSEWGHNFRFSYLNLADNLRNYCRTLDNNSPTLLALTGTASRSVLRELLTELKIDKNNSEALIRPLNFDRNELKFHITKVSTGGDSSAVLRGILNSLPSRFNLPPGEFFQPAGSSTNSGIVFTPFVNGRTHGLFAVKSAIQTALKVPVTTYSGSAPKGINPTIWDNEKQANALSFKDNEASILVATKAFGMGIDKPNIRWTVHMGVPSSMEAFYQEAGRAGRDKNLAYCSLIFSEVDPDSTDQALASNGTLDDLRQASASFKKNNDDISRALFFHLNAYSGVDEEIDEITIVLKIIGDLTERRSVEVPFDKETRPSLERAILRLIKTGLVDDLEVNYGSGYFLLKVPIFKFESARIKFEQYIADAQPARLKTIVQQLDRIENLSSQTQPIELCRLMVNFTYDVIERSRRRMLYEAILLGRNCSTDAEIRQYLLDYLQEGLGAEQIAALAEQKEIDFIEWIQLFDKVSTPLDAGEIRGIIIRLLETFPDHPGMLAARGLSEALVANPDQSLIRDSFVASFESSLTRYSCTFDDVYELFDSILTFSNTKFANLRLPLVSALQKTEAINEQQKAAIWEQIVIQSTNWDDISKLCVSAIEADHLINNSISGVITSIQHFEDLQRELK